MNKRQLRKTLRKAINESRWEEKNNHKQIGYGSGRIITDLSDEIMMVVEHALEKAHAAGATEAPEFLQELEEVALRAVQAGVLEGKQIIRMLDRQGG